MCIRKRLLGKKSFIFVGFLLENFPIRHKPFFIEYLLENIQAFIKSDRKHLFENVQLATKMICPGFFFSCKTGKV